MLALKQNDITANLSKWIIAVLIFSIIIYRLLFFPGNSHFYFLLNDIIVISLTAITILFIIKKIKLSNAQPTALVLNSGIIVTFTFLIILFIEPVFDNLFHNYTKINTNPDFFQNLILSIYSIMFLVFTCYWFATLKELYFHKRYSTKSTYFILMIVFLVLTAIANLLFRGEDFSYIKNTFLIVTLSLITLNSLKVSWIAFISKKEKISLLIFSIIISILFIVILANNSEKSFKGMILANFSPSFYKFYTLILFYGGIYFAVLFFTTLFHIPTAEAYDRKAKEVSSLQYFSKLINQVLDFEELAETITDITIKVSSAESAWIVIENKNEQKVLANKNISFADAALINKFLFENDICKKLIETKICSLEKLNDKSKLSEKFGSITVSPLKGLNETKGFLIAARKNNFIFYDEDKTAIDTFADYASVAIENSWLLEQSIEKERLEKELDVARDIQNKILPSKDPEFESLSVSSVFIPAFEVGGDYYDYFELSKNKFAFIIADVSGKGISAAFIMAEVKGIFSSLSRMLESPKEILVKANEILHQTLNKKNFVSALYGIIDLEKENILFARAGHCPALLVRNNLVKTFKPSGIGLGLTTQNIFSNYLEEIEIGFKENDLIIFYTDGVTESKNKEFEDFGEQKFSNILIEHSNKSVNQIANEVIKNVTIFSESHVQYDDITLVIFKWHKKNNISGV